MDHTGDPAEHPFPVAVCQSFYAYAWAVQNAHLLGSTAQSIICVGDSAGGNLAAVVALRALEEGIKVKPCFKTTPHTHIKIMHCTLHHTHTHTPHASHQLPTCQPSRTYSQ